MEHRDRAEALRHREDARIGEVGAQLGQVGAVERARVEVDEIVAVADHALEEGVGDPRREAAVGIPREEAIEIAAVGQVARGPLETDQVHDRHPDQRARERLRIDRVVDTAHDFDAVQLVAVDRGGETEDGAG